MMLRGISHPAGKPVDLIRLSQHCNLSLFQLSQASHVKSSSNQSGNAMTSRLELGSGDSVSIRRASSNAKTSETQRFSPAARHILESKQVDWKKIGGSQKHGLISKEDVIKAFGNGSAIAGSAKKHSAAPSPSPSPAPITQAAAPVASTQAVHATAAAAPAVAPYVALAINFMADGPVNSNYTDIPNSNMRGIIASRLTDSRATVPHFFTSIECEIDELLALRQTLKKDLGANVSVNDIVIRSAALALRDVPEANSKWNRKTGQIDASDAVDISVAVATPTGLITPIVTGADKRGLSDINSVVKELAGRAKDGKLKPSEFQGGSFTVSNLGMFGISSFTAVVNPPQACILAVGAGISRIAPPKHAGGNPRVVTTVTVQLSGDRRVVDEALAAQFLQVFKSYFSNPKLLYL